MPNKLLTIDAIAAMLDVSPRTVQREIDAGEIATVRVRRLVRIDDDEHNAIMRASAGGEKCDQIGRTFSDRTPSHKEDR